MTPMLQCQNPKCQRRYRIDDPTHSESGRCSACGGKLAATERRSLADTSDEPTQPSDSTKKARPVDGSSRFGRFQIKRRIGQGGFGDVFLAIDPQLDREVALKLLRTDRLVKSHALKRFILEAKAAGGLRHPHIVPVFDAGQQQGRYFIASAFIAGGSLEDRLIPGTAVDFRWAAEIVMQLAQALDYAHGRGVVHRDVKPANILLDDADQPHLTDFGLARVDSVDTSMTRAGHALGTPDYMPPEQARGDLDQISAASDQYSLGVTLYELLCGQTPFSGDSVQEILAAVVEQEPARPRQINSAIPVDLETICRKTMSKEPEKRYASCGQLAEDLRRWLGNEPIRARRITTVDRLVRWCRREPRIAGLTIGIFLVTLIGSAVSLWLSQVARENAQRATAGETSALENLAVAQRERYRLAVTLAHQATKSGDVGASRGYLNDAPAAQLGWEWRYVDRLPSAGLSQEVETKIRNANALFWLDDERILIVGKRPSGVGGQRSKPASVVWSSADGTIEPFGQESDDGVRGTALAFSAAHQMVALSVNGNTELWDTLKVEKIQTLPKYPGPVWIGPKGETILGLYNGGCLAWRISDGKQISRTPRSKKLRNTRTMGGRPIGVSIDPTGVRGVKGTKEGIEFFAVETGEFDRRIDVQGVAEAPKMFAWTADGAILAIVSAMGDGSLIHIIDIESGKRIGLPLKQSTQVKQIVFDASGTSLYSANENNLVTIWDLSTWRSRTLVGHVSPVVRLAVARDGRIASISGSGRLMIHQPKHSTGFATAQYRGKLSMIRDSFTESGSHASVRSVPKNFVARFTADGSSIKSCAHDVVVSCDPATGEFLDVLDLFLKTDAADAPVPSMLDALRSSRGKSKAERTKIMQAARQSNSNARRLSARTRTLRTFVDPLSRWVVRLRSTRVFDGSPGETAMMELWRLDGDRVKGDQPERVLDDAGTRVLFHPNGKHAVTVHVDHIRVLSTDSWSEIRRFSVPENRSLSMPGTIAFSDDGSMFAIFRRSQLTVIPWPDGDPSMITIPTEAVVQSESPITLSPDGSRVAVAIGEEVLLWDVADLEAAPARLPDRGAEINDVCFSPLEPRMATAGEDGVVRVWNTETLREMLSLDEHAGPVFSVDFSPDGQFLASAGRNGEIVVRDGRPR